ncbi:SDR family oxidoreductase (plasmid) [Halorussus limi]|uniref:SDR family oxidoreductase n=1 Tax=Halorussus limi TaxID=2938695 RepID=A0A8U0HZQ2_9EURY|nr:SDR family oxidoreductase [Halorussus limi]UPV76612.1 SDR family oxidoreductase [Halorussus limi]
MADDSGDRAAADGASRSVFVTGFPGFLGSELVARLLDRYPPDVAIRCLVQPKYRDLAEERAAELTEGSPDRIELSEGDITESDLGLGGDYDALAADAVEVYHLAAVYDLGVARDVGMAVNVEGTRNVLDFAERAPELRRFQYVSTCYVSGRHDGVFTHRDLDVGQSFNNHYEETKFLAEVEVQRRMDEGLPATVYRPAIAVGDSETGATQKYDGPYNVLRLLDRQPTVRAGVGVVPVFGDPRDYEVNVVPRDFVVDAIDRLSRRDDSAGEVYQLCDPNPPTVAGMVRAFGDALGVRVFRVPMPGGATLARRALESTPGLASALGVQPAVLDYFVHPTSYTCQNAVRDLRGTGVSCPPFEEYADRLVRFYRDHPDVSADAMV